MARKVLLIGWPGVDWSVLHRLLDDGSMPATQQLIDRGVVGRLAAVAPIEPYSLWTSVATGQRAHVHGILGVQSVDRDATSAVASTATARRVPALWEMLDAQALHSHVVGWPATTGSQAIAGTIVTEVFGRPDMAKTRSTLAAAVVPSDLEAELADQWMHPEETTAEVAREFLHDRCGLETIASGRLNSVAEALAFSFSRHAAFTWLLEHEAYDFATVCYPIIDWVCRRPAVTSGDQRAAAEGREIDARIIETSYRLLDELLTGVLDRVGDETSILIASPCGHGHGLASTDMRAALSMDDGRHRDRHGIVIAAGPEFARDGLLYGATVLDIVPTVLQMFGLAIDRGLGGRVLAEIFTEAPQIGPIPPGEDTVGKETMAPTSAPPPATIPTAVRDRYADLGLIPAAKVAAAADNPTATRTLRWKLARSFSESQQLLEALPLLETLSEEEPENVLYALQLANAQLQLGLLEEARDTLELILEERPGTALAHVCLARLEHRARNHDLGLEHARKAVASGRANPVLANQLGLSYLHVRCWNAALNAFADSLACDPAQHTAHLGNF